MYIKGVRTDKMPISLPTYYNIWKDIKKVYEREEQFKPLRETITSEVFDDSKQLRESDREKIFNRIRECKKKGFLNFVSKVISPLEISELMTRDEKTNLNKMSHDTVVKLIRSLLNQGINVKRVFVDTVGPPIKFENFQFDY